MAKTTKKKAHRQSNSFVRKLPAWAARRERNQDMVAQMKAGRASDAEVRAFLAEKRGQPTYDGWLRIAARYGYAGKRAKEVAPSRPARAKKAAPSRAKAVAARGHVSAGFEKLVSKATLRELRKLQREGKLVLEV